MFREGTGRIVLATSSPALQGPGNEVDSLSSMSYALRVIWSSSPLCSAGGSGCGHRERKKAESAKEKNNNMVPKERRMVRNGTFSNVHDLLFSL